MGGKWQRDGLGCAESRQELAYFLREMRAMASGMAGSLTASMDLGVGSAGSDPYLMKYIDTLERDVTAVTAQGDSRGRDRL